MTAQPEAAQPCYFGANGQLFGLYHAAVEVPSCAALLCPPLGQEMVRSHRIYRQLGSTLAAQGVAVLRFDYYGSGDSAGDGLDLDLERCVTDTVAAVGELRARSGCDHIIGFGARLGGSIALSAAVRAHFSELVLWDPVLDGAAYVAELDTMQDALRHDRMRFNKTRKAIDAADQWLGFPVSARLRGQLTEFRVAPTAIPTRLLDSTEPTFARHWDTLLSDGAAVTRLPSPTPWTELERVEHAILSPDLIRAVGDHFRATP